nr:hypothetical protein [uncultured Ottowia sp.]
METIVYFATSLIVASPIKLCDGGIFKALNLLSKTECCAQGRIRFALLRPRTDPEGIPGRNLSALKQAGNRRQPLKMHGGSDQRTYGSHSQTINPQPGRKQAEALAFLPFDF